MGLQNILTKTEEYLSIPSVVRFEHPFMNHLAEDFSISGYEVEKQDRLLVVTKKGLKSPKILTTHIDRHGIVINQDGDFEYAAFNAKKYYKIENKSEEDIFKKSGERFIDELVYAYDSNGKRLDEGKVKGFKYDFDKKDLFFEIEGLEGLASRIAIAYKSSLNREGGNISSQIDNAISVAVAHQLVQDGFDGRIIFSTEDEIGMSWQHVVNYLTSLGITSQELISLDTTPYDDSRAIQEGLIVLRNRDENGMFNKDFVVKLKNNCDREGIKYEMKDEVIEAQNTQLPKGFKPKDLGKTELGRIIQHTNSDFNGATIQLPSTGYHTNHETTSELALNNYYQILKKLL